MTNFNFYDKEKNNSNLQALADALNNRKQVNIGTVPIQTPAFYGQTNSNNNADMYKGIGQLANGAIGLGKTAYNIWKNGGLGGGGLGNGLASGASNMGLGGLENLSFLNGLGGSGIMGQERPLNADTLYY